MVTTTTPGGQRVTICTCTRTGRHLATFTHRPGSSLYTLATEPPQVAASVQVSLPPLPPSPAPPCLPCVEGRQRAAPHSSSFPPMTAPLQTLHMDVWGPARVSGQSHKRYFMLAVDDYMRYTTVFPLRSKGQRFGLLRDFCRGEGILQSFTLLDSPQQNGIAKRRIGLVMEVARTSIIHAAAPHFLWPFAVRYAAHQLNLWPRVSLSETSPTLHWMGKVGDAGGRFRVWESRAFVCDTSTDKLSPRAIPCVFLGFVPDALGWQFYHPTWRCVFPSQDVMFDESIPFYRLFPYRSAPPPPPPLFLAPSASRGSASGGAGPWGDASGGAGPGGAESEGAETRGAEPGGVEPGGGEPGGTEPEGVEPGGAASEGTASEGAESGGAEPQGAASSRGSPATAAEGAGVADGAGVPGGTAVTGPGGARTRGIGAAETGGVEGGGAGDPTKSGATDVGGSGAGSAGAGGAGVGGTGAGGAGVGGPGVGGAGAGGAGAPASPLPAPSPYTEQIGGLIEHREPASRLVSPVRTARRVPRTRPPPLPGTHAMTLRPSSVPLRVPLPAPPESSLCEVLGPESDHVRAASPTFSCLLATAVTDPFFEAAAASALVAELLDFAVACRLDYATALVAESESASPPSVGGAVASNAPDIPTPRSYAEAITGPYSSQWQAAMDAEMASRKSIGTFVDEDPPPGANIVDGMWIFRVKRPPGSPPVFKARYIARGFCQR
ncbi:unnamed protein product [Closterium sp. NIES-54]